MKPTHLTDADLLMLADGELPDQKARQARAHLDSCWTCRERMGRIEDTIADFVRARNHELNEHILPAAGPRAMLRARMAEISANPGPTRPRGMTGRVLAAAACGCAAVGTLMFFESKVSAEGPRPNAQVTPGETRPITMAEVCSKPAAEVVVSDIAQETRLQVLAKYGIRAGKPGEFEVDYLITPDLGGAETVKNLWPQPYSARWNAKQKDELEQKLHDLVCSGSMDLPTAQREIAKNWIAAYKKYVSKKYVRVR